MECLGGKWKRPNRRFPGGPLGPLLLVSLFLAAGCAAPPSEAPDPGTETNGAPGFPEAPVSLPEPHRQGEQPLETALSRRESLRSFASQPLALEEISQLLWAGQGIVADSITGATRTAPSAGATHPLVLYLVTPATDELAAGVYRYNPGGHSLDPVKGGDRRQDLAEAALDQAFVGEAPVITVIGAHYVETTRAYGERGERYAKMESGHAAQNICLQARALELGSVVIGAFCDETVSEVLGTDTEPLYIIPLGKPE